MSFSAFKSVRVYRLSAPIESDVELFANALQAFKFTPCMAQDTVKTGFANPLHKSIPALAHKVGDNILFAIKTQKKVLPTQSVNDALEPKLQEKEQELGRPLTRKEKSVLKDAVIDSLLPRCLTNSSVLNGYYDTRRQLLVIGSGSSSRCEDVLALLRKALGSLPALPFFDSHQLVNKLQLWGKNESLPAGFEIGAKLHFKAPDEEGGKARFDNHLLTHTEVQAHFEDKLAVLLELVKQDEMTFTLKDDGNIAGIKYNDKLVGTNDELGWEDLIARLDADMLLLADSLGGLIDVFMKEMPPAAQAESDPESEQYSESDVAFDDSSMVERAKAFVIETRRASVSAMQRHLRIGYNRASNIIEELERQGVVSAPGHLGNREVLA